MKIPPSNTAGLKGNSYVEAQTRANADLQIV
jgi:hypothetical protein